MSEEKKRILEVLVNKEGKLFVNTIFKTKEEGVRCLCDALKIAAMQKDNVVNVKPGFFRKAKKAGGFGGNS